MSDCSPWAEHLYMQRPLQGGCLKNWRRPKYGHISYYMRDILHWLLLRKRILSRAFSFVWCCVLLALILTSYMEPFILTSACSGRQSLRSVSRGDFVVSHALTAIKQHI